MTVTTQREERPRYGNFFVHRNTGLGSLGWGGTFIAGGGALAAMLAVTFAGLFTMLAVLVVTAGLLSLLLFRDRVTGRNLGQRIANRWAFSSSVRAGTNELRQGPLSVWPYGEVRLPGIAAQTELTEHVDSWSQPFVLLSTPSVDAVATLWNLDPPGCAMLNDETIEQMVADFGGWLAGHTMEDGLVGASVTFQTIPDHGHGLRAAVEPRRAARAPSVAVAAVNASLERMSVGGASVQAWASATFTTKPSGDDEDDYDDDTLATYQQAVDLIDPPQPRRRGRRKTVEEMARELAPRAPLIGDALRAGGAGTVRPTIGQELCERVRAAYDPEVAEVIDAAHAEGAPIPLNWTEVGPMGHRAGWRQYVHDSGTSVTWVMARPPQGAVLSNILARLLAPHPAVDVKRVTLLYRPWELGEATARARADAEDAEYAAKNPIRGRVNADATTMLRRARHTDEEVAEGAGLLNFAVVVTATVLDRAQLRQARAVTSSLNKSARLVMREATGWQDTAFVYGLGIGYVPALHDPLPDAIKERM